MQTYTVITSRREFQLDANSMEQAVHKAGGVLHNEKLIIICDASQVDVNYTDGIVKAKR